MSCEGRVRVYRVYGSPTAKGARGEFTGPPERNFPLPVVIGHGIFATATIVLAFLTALREGGS